MIFKLVTQVPHKLRNLDQRIKLEILKAVIFAKWEPTKLLRLITKQHVVSDADPY
jgi:hypothetical protein